MDRKYDVITLGEILLRLSTPINGRLKAELSDLGSNVELGTAEVLHQRVALCKTSVDRTARP